MLKDRTFDSYLGSELHLFVHFLYCGGGGASMRRCPPPGHLVVVVGHPGLAGGAPLERYKTNKMYLWLRMTFYILQIYNGQ